MKNLVVLSLTLILTSTYLAGAVLRVPQDHNSIQQAIDSAADFDTVLVDSGVYYENINIKGKKILLTSNYLLDQDEKHILNTVIDGSNPNFADSASCIRIISKEDSNTVIQGFTLTNGTGTVWPDVYYGGTLYREGGGFFIDSSSPVIRYNLIVNNPVTNTAGVHSAGGGAIRAADSDPTITGNVIMNNQAHYGAGVALYHSSGKIYNNLVYNNSGGSYYHGAGVWVLGSSSDTVEIFNNTVVDNFSLQRGGGLFLGNSVVWVKNNILWDNYGLNGGHQIYQSGGWVEVTYCDVQDGYTGTGNIDSDPLFTDYNFHLDSASPCIDSGDPNSGFDPEDSLNPGSALYPSMGGLEIDMGCYGGEGRIEFPDITSLVAVEERPEVLTLQNVFMDIQWIDEGSFQIRLNLPREQPVTVKIYNVQGTLVNTILNNKCQQYQAVINWNCTDYNNARVRSGIYFVKALGEDFNVTEKIWVLL